MTEIFLGLPFPPSVNNLFVNTARAGRRKSKRYLAWIKEAGMVLEIQQPIPINGPVEVWISLTPPDQRKRDLDNFTGKALLTVEVTKAQWKVSPWRWRSVLRVLAV